MDVNQGTSGHQWDVKFTDFDFMAAIFNQAVANNSHEFVVIIILDVAQVHEYSEALLQAKFDHLRGQAMQCMPHVMRLSLPLRYAVKSVAPTQHYVKATEQILIAKSPAKASTGRGGRKHQYARHFVDSNPKRRYDFFLGPDEPKKEKFNNDILNKTQKPAWLANYLAKPYVGFGDTALVFGAGAGGDIAGLLNLGLNVIALESNDTQYFALQSKFSVYNPYEESFLPDTMYEIEANKKVDKSEGSEGDEEEEFPSGDQPPASIVRSPIGNDKIAGENIDTPVNVLPTLVSFFCTVLCDFRQKKH